LEFDPQAKLVNLWYNEYKRQIPKKGTPVQQNGAKRHFAELNIPEEVLTITPKFHQIILR